MLREFSAVLLLVAAGSAVIASPIPGLYDSGSIRWTVSFGACPWGANNCVLGDIYSQKVVEAPIDAALVQPNASQFAPADYPFWYTGPLRENDRSVWIAPSVRGMDSPDGPAMANTIRYLPPDIGGPMDFGVAEYEYRTWFNLDGFDPDTAWIDLIWLADGMMRPGDCGIRLNDTCIPTPNEGFQYSRPGVFRTFINRGFAAGDNQLSFFVGNRYRETGLRVSFDSFVASTPEPSTYSLIAAGFAVLVWKRKRWITR